MGYKLVFDPPHRGDKQDELPIALCPECLGEIYEGDALTFDGYAVYHEKCCERMVENGNRRHLPPGKS